MSVKILIELMEDGNVTINGPLENKVLCYGLLKMGEVLVTNYEAKKIIPMVMVPCGSVLGRG